MISFFLLITSQSPQLPRVDDMLFHGYERMLVPVSKFQLEYFSFNVIYSVEDCQFPE